jgi:hypothetical protein
MTPSEPPLLVIGVRRSGTTLLRVMLDRNSQLALPDESYFVPQLAARHPGPIEVDRFVDDLRRIGTLREWGIAAERVRSRLREGMPAGVAIAAVYETYAADRGKGRWGDKTPMYMQYLPLLERLFPDALFVHLVRDGRDAALSFLAMKPGIVTRTWAHPRSVADFACQWRSEVEAASLLGVRVGPARYREIRYEALVSDPERELRGVCTFARLTYEPDMLRYAEDIDVSARPHQQRLKQPPTPGVRNWRKDMTSQDAAAFEDVAGAALARLGYPLTAGRPTPPSARARARLASYRARSWAWRTTSTLVQRSPLWRRRHPPLG